MDLLSTGVTALWFYYLLEELLCGSINSWSNCSVVLLYTGVKLFVVLFTSGGIALWLY